MNRKNDVSKMKQSMKLFLSCLLLLAILFNTCGCSLAAQGGASEQSKDQLIGAIVTKDYIEKTYADVQWDGKAIESLNFEGIEGHYAIYTCWENEDGTPVYGRVQSEGITGSTNYTTKDLSQSIELNINAYLIPGTAEESNTIYMNPIYMTSDDRVYTVVGSSASLGKGFDSFGASVGRTLKETEKLKWIDSVVKVDVNVTLDVSLAKEPVRIWLSQMDSSHNLVKKEEYVAGQLPEELIAEEQTEYIMVIMEQIGENGETELNREICSWDGTTTYEPENAEKETAINHTENNATTNTTNSSVEKNASLLNTFYSDGSGFLLQQNTWVIWPE